MKNEENVMDYLRHGKKLFPLVGRVSITKDWVNAVIPEDKLRKHNDNFGWAINPSSLVIDVDPRNGGKDSFKLLTNFLGVELEPTVLTPSGGFHIYMTIPEQHVGKAFKKTLNKDFPGIDFLTHGCYCVIAGSTALVHGSKTEMGKYSWVDDFDLGFLETPAPLKLFELISYDAPKSTSDLAEYQGLLGASSSAWSTEKVQSLLDKLDPSMGNDEWVKVGMALHDWDSQLGLDLWEAWSKAGDNYVENQTTVRWNSFDSGGGVTLGTVSYMVKGVTFDEEKKNLAKFLRMINNADERSLELDVIPKLKKENLNADNKEIIVKALQDKCKDLTGVRLSISRLREKITGQEIVTGSFVEDGERPKWCENWVYILSHNCFANLHNSSIYKLDAFNLANGKYLPKGVNGSKQKASTYVSDNGFVPIVSSMVFMPTFKEKIITLNGKTYLNMFDIKNIPLEDREYTDEGRALIKMIRKHVAMVVGKDNAPIFLQWLAHQVQFPGKKILWSPVIQSIEGVGKSFFGEMLRLCLGVMYVGTVNPTQVSSNFNGWAIGSPVVILEEIRIKGHNRYDAVNALKPLITDAMIQINDKGVKPFMTYNTTNYLCFTNYKDAIPLSRDDRRWWIIFCQILKLSDVTDKVGMDYTEYFPMLFSLLRKHPGQVRKWLLEYKIQNEFLNMKQAPRSEFKDSMVETEKMNLEGLSETEELINRGGDNYNANVICSVDLFNDLTFEYPHLNVQTTAKTTILKALGYTVCPGVVNVRGKAKKVWYKQALTNHEIRLFLRDEGSYEERNIDEDFLDDI